MPIGIDVAICTGNRSAELAHTLESLRDQIVPEHLRWRVLVVDNGCTEDTDAVIDRFRSRLPLVGLHAPVVAKAAALNVAIAALREDWV